MLKVGRMGCCGLACASMLGGWALAGCAAGGPGAELGIRPQPFVVAAPEAKTLRVPQDERFSIVLSPSSREPGPGGAADARADADAGGSAEVKADVQRGGKASGTFQLGHAWKNDTDRQIDVALATEYRYAFSVQAEQQPGARDAGIDLSLKFYARDHLNRLVRSVDLVQHTTEQGDAARQSQESFRVTLPLPPGATIYVYLAGHVTIDTARSGRSASGELRVSDVRLEAALSPAPAVGSSP
ncbi:MAG: hypothetical protein AB7Q17_16635 [Phycisphaerae bacterium]